MGRNVDNSLLYQGIIKIISVMMACGSCRFFRQWTSEFFAEFLGTFLLVFVGNNAIAESILTDGQAGNSMTIYVGYGLGLFLGINVAGGVSGGHLNPAVTLAGAIVKRFQWSKVFHYLLAQYLGAFVAACLTYLVYKDSINDFYANKAANTASIFATYPKDGVSLFGAIIDQILGSMVLVMSLYAVTDERNTKVPLHVISIYMSLTLIGIACSLGINQGFAVNPARDLSPRFFTYLAGWGSHVFSYASYWYVPVIGPHIGAILGATIYIFLIEKMRCKEKNDNRFYLPPPEIKEFASYSNPAYSVKDEFFPCKKEIYTCYL